MYDIKEVGTDRLKEILSVPEIEASFFVTPEWLSFLESDGHGTPVILEIEDKEKFVAVFVGLRFKKFGIKMVASPFEQWGTCDMGFCGMPGTKYEELLEPVAKFIKKKYHCSYFEVIDDKIDFEQLKNIKCHIITQQTYTFPLQLTDEQLFKRFKTDARNFIRQFERRGATITQVEPSDRFADEYYDQLIEVFAKQNLRPHGNRQKIHNVMKAFKDNPENILCLRVTDPDGNCIATSIFFGFSKKAYFWGAASYREHQHYRPNEYMIWTAVKYWRERGVQSFDMVGLREYKKKFGPDLYKYPRIIITSNRLLIIGRNLARKTIALLRKVRGK